MTEWREAYRKRIEEPLERLARTAGKPFVVVTDTVSGKFVQFSGSRTEAIMFTLPVSQILSEDELTRAASLLRQQVVKMGPRTPKSYVVFSAGPYDDVEAAAEIALDVMDAVFRAQGNDLKVEFSKG